MSAQRQRPTLQLINFDDRNHFSGPWINPSDRRSATLRSKQLFIGTPIRGISFCPVAGLAFLSGTLVLVNERWPRHALSQLWDNATYSV